MKTPTLLRKLFFEQAGFLRRHTMDMATKFAMLYLAKNFQYRRFLRSRLKNRDGWIDFQMGIVTDTGTVAQKVVFKRGKVSVIGGDVKRCDVLLRLADEKALMTFLTAPPNVVLLLVLRNELIVEGNLFYLQFFTFLVSELRRHQLPMELDKVRREDKAARECAYHISDPSLAQAVRDRRQQRLSGVKGADENVRFLEDPYLSQYNLDSFPRIKAIRDIHLRQKPEVSAERPKLLTEWFRRNGFETKPDGTKWSPVLRQAEAFKHLMVNKRPVIQRNNLLAGSMGPEDLCVLIYPDTSGLYIWGELRSLPERPSIPHQVSQETLDTFADIFPFWLRRNPRHFVREKYNYPECQKIDERMAAYSAMKMHTFSHTVPGTPRILQEGTRGLLENIERRLSDTNLSDHGREQLEAMQICLEGLEGYAQNLCREAERQAFLERSPERAAELRKLAKLLRRVPQEPSETLEEAMNAALLFLVGCFMENTNISLSPGRLDQFFQPYFEADMAKLDTDEQRRSYIGHAIELAACLHLRLAHHTMTIPDVANVLYGGTQTDSAVTYGGVTPEGEDGVNDMTYIFLKVTEMLSLVEPNVNVRFHPEINSDTFLRRICEVNYITSGTPSIHNDEAIFRSFSRQPDWKIEDIRDWAATGCVEPTLSGKHIGHTNALSVNLVAGLEMAMHNGYHPLMKWAVGPQTGSIEKGDFPTFEAFFQAYRKQMAFLLDNVCELNNYCGEAHAQLRPTPFLSVSIDGCIKNAEDATRGGATYNTSGSFNAGVADVVDSLLVIKKLVFDDKKVTFAELALAVDTDFRDHPKLLALARNKVPLWGSGSAEAVALMNRTTRMIADLYDNKRNFRGGRYTTGFWSSSWHSAFGQLTGTLPSGRLAGKAFTPGINPQPNASTNLLDNIRDVSQLDVGHIDNNIAFNIKLAPDVRDSHEQTVEHMVNYAKAYMRLGGMQMQYNMISSDTLKDAVAHPERYRDLLVRISGYNAFFVELPLHLQQEIIERAEYGGRLGNSE